MAFTIQTELDKQPPSSPRETPWWTGLEAWLHRIWQRADRVLLVGWLLFVLAGAILGLTRPVSTPPDLSWFGPDEWQHTSAVHSQGQHPRAFIDWPHEKLINLQTGAWTHQGTYINHPGLYYWLLSFLADHPAQDLIPLRLANLLLSSVAMALILVKGACLFPDQGPYRLWGLATLLFCKALTVSGFINNDNLAILAAAMVFAGLVESRTLWLAAGLALAGWCKLTALIGLGLVVGLWRLQLVMQARAAWFSMTHVWLAAGALIGSVPTLANLVTYGHMIYWNADLLHAIHEDDFPTDQPGLFAVGWFAQFVKSWNAKTADWIFRLGVGEVLASWLPFALTFAPLTLVVRKSSLQDTLARAYLGALLGMIALHFQFALSFLQNFHNSETGDIRYYWILWPGLMVGAARGLYCLPERWHSFGSKLYLAFLLIGTFPYFSGRIL